MEESETGTRYYNSAYLISPAGKLVDVYDKIRLIPFAEYRPLTLPVLHNHSAEYPSEFTAGKRATVFPLPPQGAFGVMICYEADLPSPCPPSGAGRCAVSYQHFQRYLAGEGGE